MHVFIFNSQIHVGLIEVDKTLLYTATLVMDVVVAVAAVVASPLVAVVASPLAAVVASPLAAVGVDVTEDANTT